VSEPTRFSSVSERGRQRLYSAIRDRDVRAADLREKPMKRVQIELLQCKRFVGFDEDGDSPANIGASR